MCQIVRHVYIWVYIMFEDLKYLGDIRNNYKLKILILFSECVTCSDILKQGSEELHFTE